MDKTLNNKHGQVRDHIIRVDAAVRVWVGAWNLCRNRNKGAPKLVSFR